MAWRRSRKPLSTGRALGATRYCLTAYVAGPDIEGRCMTVLPPDALVTVLVPPPVDAPFNFNGVENVWVTLVGTAPLGVAPDTASTISPTSSSCPKELWKAMLADGSIAITRLPA